jgi:hypothetical protein
LNRNESGRFGALKSDSTHHFFDTMERVRTAKKKKHYFPKASNQPAMVEQPIGLRYGYKINENLQN